jgi:hypothetical protein
MKTGIELIAEARNKIRPGRDMRAEQIIDMVKRADRYDILGNPRAGLDDLAEAGALIAAEIDRINNLYQE